MLDDGNPRAEQTGMHGARSVIGRIDVERIDADEGDAGFDQLFGEAAREVRMLFEILIGAPVHVPTGVNEERFALRSVASSMGKRSMARSRCSVARRTTTQSRSASDSSASSERSWPCG